MINDKEKFRKVIKLVQETLLDYDEIAQRVSVTEKDVKEIDKKYKIRTSPYSEMYKRILHDLQNGDNRNIICNRYNQSYYIVNKIFKDNNIKTKIGNKDSELNKKIVELFKKDYTINEIATELCCSRSYVSKYLLSIKAKSRIITNKDMKSLNRIMQGEDIRDVALNSSYSRLILLSRVNNINIKNKKRLSNRY